MNQLIKKKIEIYEIRDKQVMFDSDLTILYSTETKTTNEVVKNIKNKFPKRFAQQHTNEKYQNLKSKNSTSSLNNYGGRRKLPHVFTEQGIATLATITKN